MEEWRKYKLKDFIEFNPKEKVPQGELCRKISMDQITPFTRFVESNIYEVYKGGVKFRNYDTIMARITPCLENGKTAYISSLHPEEVAVGSTEYIVLRKRENISDSKFIFYLAISPIVRDIAIKSMVGSSGRQRVQQDVLENYEIPIPSLPMQKNIAHILSVLDDKIELNKRINDNLEQQAQALFKSWFVDFEPFKEGKFVDSELGMIPESWRVCSAETIFKINIGKTPPRKEQQWFSNINNGNVKWISISDLGSNEIFIEDSKEYLTKEAISKFNIIVVPKDTILVSFKLTVGRVGISNCELTTNEAVARFYLPKSYFREYTYLSLKNYNYARLGSTSSIATAVNSKIIKNMKLLIPPATIISEFSKRVNPLFNAIRIYENEIRNLSKIRNTLLPKLMSGELKINDINN